MNDPEVSVIVLSFNQRASLARTLDSILSQKCGFRYEIVVSDDCSTDGTRELALDYGRRYPDTVTVLPAGERRGLVRNYFHAFSACRGRFVTDCSADDMMLGELSLQRKYDVLVTNPGVVMVHSDWLTFPAGRLSERRQSGHEAWPEGVISGRKLLKEFLSNSSGPVVQLSTVLYRREALAEILARRSEMVCNEDFGCEDLPLIAALLNRGDAYWLPEATLLYQLSDDSLSSPVNVRRLVEFYRKTIAADALLSTYYGIPRRDMKKRLATKLRYAMSQAFHDRFAEGALSLDRMRRTYGLNGGLKYALMFMACVLIGRRCNG